MIYNNLILHNINEVEEKDGKNILHRFPRQVREKLESDGLQSMRHSTSEIRFIIKGKVRVRLSPVMPNIPSQVIVYYGDNPWDQHNGTSLIIPLEGVDIELEPWASAGNVPRRWRYPSDLVRVRLSGSFSLDGISGDYETPGPDSFPEKKYLAYGTSITHGSKSLLPDLNYSSILGHMKGMDVYNYGMGGACFIEDAIAAFLCQESYDLITLCLSVNMLHHDYTVDRFRERADRLVRGLREKNPGSPIALLSILTYWSDLGIFKGKPLEMCTAYRETLEDISRNYPGTVFLDGRKTLSWYNLTTDLLHPGDYGMIEIASKLYGALEEADRGVQH